MFWLKKAKLRPKIYQSTTEIYYYQRRIHYVRIHYSLYIISIILLHFFILKSLENYQVKKTGNIGKHHWIHAIRLQNFLKKYWYFDYICNQSLKPVNKTFRDKWIGLAKSIGIEIKRVYSNHCHLAISYKNINLSKVNSTPFATRVHC